MVTTDKEPGQKKNKKFVQFDISTLNKTVPYELSNFSNNKVNNSFNFLSNNTTTSKIKRLLNTIGFLQLGYYLNERKKKWDKMLNTNKETNDGTIKQ